MAAAVAVENKGSTLVENVDNVSSSIKYSTLREGTFELRGIRRKITKPKPDSAIYVFQPNIERDLKFVVWVNKINALSIQPYDDYVKPSKDNRFGVSIMTEQKKVGLGGVEETIVLNEVYLNDVKIDLKDRDLAFRNNLRFLILLHTLSDLINKQREEYKIFNKDIGSKIQTLFFKIRDSFKPEIINGTPYHYSINDRSDPTEIQLRNTNTEEIFNFSLIRDGQLIGFTMNDKKVDENNMPSDPAGLLNALNILTQREQFGGNRKWNDIYFNHCY